MDNRDNIMNPRESAAFICDHAEDVKINHAGIHKAASDLIRMFKEDQSYMQHKAWKAHPLNPKVANEKAIDWIFLVDALNFSFWTPSGSVKYQINYAGSLYTGYWSLCAVINRALDIGVPITTAEYLAKVTEDQAADIFKSDSTTPIPMLKKRVEVMKEIGSVLLQKFDGKFSNCIRQSNGSAQSLLKLVVDNFPCFQDEAIFKSKHVSFYKRAQILVADVWACFEGLNLGLFHDIDSITMFADYRIPQTLVYFGVMTYSKELMALLTDDHMFNSGDQKELEIRAASIHAVELLCKIMMELLQEDTDLKGKTVNAILLDHFLWDYRRAHDEQTKHIPFHKIRCVYY